MASEPNRETILYQRAFALLHRFAVERKGWRSLVFGRWYFKEEPLRHDAGNLVREAGYAKLQRPDHRNTTLAGGRADGK